jgi:hypothetical protein
LFSFFDYASIVFWFYLRFSEGMEASLVPAYEVSLTLSENCKIVAAKKVVAQDLPINSGSRE